MSVACSQPLPLQAQLMEEKSQQQKRKKADQVKLSHVCTHTITILVLCVVHALEVLNKSHPQKHAMFSV